MKRAIGGPYDGYMIWAPWVWPDGYYVAIGDMYQWCGRSGASRE